MNIDPNKKYTPFEIADKGLILSRDGTKSLRAIQRYIKNDQLKAQAITIGKSQKQYLVKGSEIIKYLEKFPNPAPALHL